MVYLLGVTDQEEGKTLKDFDKQSLYMKPANNDNNLKIFLRRFMEKFSKSIEQNKTAINFDKFSLIVKH